MSHLLIPLSEDPVALEMSLETVCFQYETLLCINSTPTPSLFQLFKSTVKRKNLHLRT